MEIKKIRIFANQDSISKLVLKELVIKLKDANFIISDNDFDLGISIGGDGAFLRMLREVDFNDTPYYVGINTGSLGFIEDFTKDNLEDFITYLKEDKFKTFPLLLSEIKILTPSKTLKYKAINEFSIRDATLKSIHLDIMVDNTKLETFVGDGLLISTPFGSTAYNLSQGGSIIYPQIEVLEVTPFAPINNSFYKTLINPFLISSSNTLEFKLESKSHPIIIQRDSEKIFEGIANNLKINLLPSKIKCLVKDCNYTERLKDKIIKR